MATITVSLPSDGDTIDVADYNTPITTIVNDYNGNITNANISAAAGISGSKLADSSVTIPKITNPYKFSAYQGSNQTYSDGDVIKLDTESYDTNSNFATNTYTYTVPVTGIYHFSFSAYSTAATSLVIALYVGGTLDIRGSWPSQTGSYIVSNGSGDLSLTAGDAVTLKMLSATGTKSLIGASNSTYLNGHLIAI